MSVNHYNLYLDGVFRLAKSISIKSEYSARKINTRMELIPGQTVDHHDPTTWKNYLNKAGIYHSTDTMMVVISMDTRQPINFTKEVLEDHPATREYYRVGTRYYKELVLQYPNQRTLINGIIYPRALNEIVAAEDMSILSWDTALVEPNEENLIKDLEKIIQNFYKRWFVSGFTVSHSLYDVTFFNMMFQLLPSFIIDIRARACHTYEAHSFHVAMFLASHNGLDQYLPQLNAKQKMWLYRNIRFIRNQAGKDSTLKLLVQNLLTERGIPLMSYDVVQNANNLLEGEAVPSMMFKQNAENNIKPAQQDLIQPATMLGKIAAVAPGNEEFDKRNPQAISDLAYERKNSYTTKVLETEAVEVSISSSLTDVEVALSHWGFAAATNRLNVFTRINNPLTGEEVTISALDAYYLFMFAYSKAHGSGIPFVPLIFSKTAPVWPRPSEESLLNITIRTEIEIDLVGRMRNLMPSSRNYINFEQFREGVKSLSLALEQHWRFVHMADTTDKKVSFKSVMGALWADRSIILPETNTDIIEYFEGKSITFGDMEQSLWIDLYMGLFKDITGLEMETVEEQNAVQRAMVDILRKLSSYSIMFVDPKAALQQSGFIYDYPLLDESESSSTNVYDVIPAVIRLDFRKDESIVTKEVPLGVTEIGLVIAGGEKSYEIKTDVHLEGIEEDNNYSVVVPIGIVSMVPINDNGELDPEFIPGYDETAALGEALAKIPNIYNYQCYPHILEPAPLDPNDLITTTHIPIKMAPETRASVLRDFKPFQIPTPWRYFSDDAEIIVLDGIWPNFGDLDLDVFEFFAGYYLLDPFKLTPMFDFDLDTWKPNIGGVVVKGIGPYTDPEKSIDLGSFIHTGSDAHISIVIAPTFGHHQLEIVNTLATADFMFVNTATSAQFSFHLKKEVYDIGAFIDKAYHVRYALKFIGTELDLGILINRGGENVSIGFTSKAFRYQIGSFNVSNNTVVFDKLHPGGIVNIGQFNSTANNADLGDMAAE